MKIFECDIVITERAEHWCEYTKTKERVAYLKADTKDELLELIAQVYFEASSLSDTYDSTILDIDIRPIRELEIINERKYNPRKDLKNTFTYKRYHKKIKEEQEKQKAIENKIQMLKEEKEKELLKTLITKYGAPT